jgi:dUTP pyrophosphatase
MMRAMLYGTGLGSQYWAYSLRHAVYVKNRLPHSLLNYKTPYERMNGKQPDLTNMQVFGSKVHFMHQERSKKLDRMDRSGLFMTFKGLDKISYVIDNKTQRERTVTHATFDEAHMSLPATLQPPMAMALQQSGYIPEKEDITPVCDLKVKLLLLNAKCPVQASSEAAGFDIYSHEDITIAPGEQAKIGTKIALEIPHGYHGQLLVCSRYAAKYRARVEAGVIDSDYRGEIFVLISNNGNNDMNITKGDRIAQMIIAQDPLVSVSITNDLSTRAREKAGFGSTGIKDIISQKDDQR